MAVSSWFIQTSLAGCVLTFISVCLETRWLGPNSTFYVPERPCSSAWPLLCVLQLLVIFFGGNTVLECSALAVFCLASLTLCLAFCSHHSLYLLSTELRSSLVLCLACKCLLYFLVVCLCHTECSRSNTHSSPQPSTVMLCPAASQSLGASDPSHQDW